MGSHPLHITTGGMDTMGFVRLFRRWLLFSRNGLPFEFTRPIWLRSIGFFVAVTALALSLHKHLWMPALFATAALAGFLWAGLAIGRRFGGAHVEPRYWWVPFFLVVIAPVEAGISLVHKRVNWRGRAYDLDAHARLA
jgi:hypothetical protein